jgi:hypothetical protein
MQVKPRIYNVRRLATRLHFYFTKWAEIKAPLLCGGKLQGGEICGKLPAPSGFLQRCAG